jgi:hypothetical protein
MPVRSHDGHGPWGPAYPVVRDFLAYGLGLAGPYEARESLNPRTTLTRVHGVSADDVRLMAAFAEEMFGLSGRPLASLAGGPLHVYLGVLADSLRSRGVTLRQARTRMWRALPDDWRAAARAQAGASRRPRTNLRRGKLRPVPAA